MEREDVEDVQDVVVVGGGSAGLSAGLWLGRYRRRTLVLDSGEHRNRWADQAHGYLGCDPVDPGQLLEAARQQVGRYPTVELRAGRATSARVDGEGFRVDLDDGSVLAARRLVLATGVVDELPDVDGFFDHYGTTVFHCPTCDGFEARDKRVVVIGWAEQVAGFALGLLDWAASITIVTDGHRFDGDDEHRDALTRHRVDVRTDQAVALVGAPGALEGVRLVSGGVLPAEQVFFSLRHRPASDLAEQLGCHFTDEGCVEVDDRGETSVPGVYAAGDMTPGVQLLQVAAAKGAVAGVHCAQSLRGEPPVPGEPPPGPDPT